MFSLSTVPAASIPYILGLTPIPAVSPPLHADIFKEKNITRIINKNRFMIINTDVDSGIDFFFQFTIPDFFPIPDFFQLFYSMYFQDQDYIGLLFG